MAIEDDRSYEGGNDPLPPIWICPLPEKRHWKFNRDHHNVKRPHKA